MVVLFAFKHLRAGGMHVVWRVADLHLWRCLSAIFARHVGGIVCHMAGGNGVGALDRWTSVIAQPAQSGSDRPARRSRISRPGQQSHQSRAIGRRPQQWRSGVLRSGDPPRGRSKPKAVSFDSAAARQSRWERLRHCMQTPRDMVESLVLLSVIDRRGRCLPAKYSQLGIGRQPVAFALGVRARGGQSRHYRGDAERTPKSLSAAVRKSPPKSKTRKPWHTTLPYTSNRKAKHELSQPHCRR